jgi:hypothetical protein
VKKPNTSPKEAKHKPQRSHTKAKQKLYSYFQAELQTSCTNSKRQKGGNVQGMERNNKCIDFSQLLLVVGRGREGILS